MHVLLIILSVVVVEFCYCECIIFLYKYISIIIQIRLQDPVVVVVHEADTQVPVNDQGKQEEETGDRQQSQDSSDVLQKGDTCEDRIETQL